MKKERFHIFNTFRENGGDKETRGNPPAQENPETEGKSEYPHSHMISLKLIERSQI